MSFFRVGNIGLLFSATGVQQVPLGGADYPPVSTGRLWANPSFPADWGRDSMLLDVMRYARTWRAQTSTEFNDETLQAEMMATADADDYPTQLPAGVAAGTIILTNQPAASAALIGGRYRLEWEGSGTVTVAGGSGQTSGANWLEFDYTPTGSNLIDIRITATAGGGNHVKGMRCYMLEHAALVAAGKKTHPAFAAVWGGVKLLRFMDHLNTNTAPYINWSDAPTDTSIGRGPSLADLVDVCNELGCDGWFNMAYQSTSDYVTQAATLVRDRLNPALKAYVEYANEWWNFGGGFSAAPYLEALREGKSYNWAEQAGGRSTETMLAWSAVFAGQMHRTVRVAGMHTGWQGISEDFLNAPGWVAEEVGRVAPHTVHDAIAVTGYFFVPTDEWPAILSAAGSDYEAGKALMLEVANENIDNLIGVQWPGFRSLANSLGLDLLMYEGGTHIVNPGGLSNPSLANSLINDLNEGPEMYSLYARMMLAWDEIGDGGFNLYSTVTPENTIGAFGTQYHLADTSQGRFQVCQDYNSGTLAGTPLGGQTVDVFAYYNSLHNHANPASDQNVNTRVGNWMYRMGIAAPNGGNSYSLGSQFGFFNQWTAPPNVSYREEEVPDGPMTEFVTGWGGGTGIEVVEFVPDNFDGQNFDPAANTNMGAAYQSTLLALIDAWESNAPNANRRYVIYAGWPTMGLYGATDDDPGTMTSTGKTNWINYGLGAYQSWMELLVSRLQAARPALDIRLHNVSKATLLTFRDTIVSTVPYDVLFEDLAPHGRSTGYFLAAVAEYIELYDEKPPSDFVFDPAWAVSSIVEENYQDIVDYIWGVLRP